MSYCADGTHKALGGLDWKTYFTQEGDNSPQPANDLPIVQGVDSADGVLSLEQLLDAGGGDASDHAGMVSADTNPVPAARQRRRASAC